MKKLLLFFISLPIINNIGRNFFLLIIKTTGWIQKHLALRWILTGEVQLNLSGLKFKVFSKGDDGQLPGLYYGFGGEKYEIHLMSIIAPKCRVILDIGANTGIMSMAMSKAAPSATIYAFEPVPANYKRLQKNIEINNITNVEVINKAVGKVSDQLQFTVPKNRVSEVTSAVENYAQTFGRELEFEKIQVEQISIDEFVSSHQLKNVDFMKIDVELFELNVLEGAKETITRFKPAILCEILLYDFMVYACNGMDKVMDPMQTQQIQNFFSRMGYHFYFPASTGLVRVDNIQFSVDSRNFFFSPYKSEKVFFPYDDILNQLRGG